MRGAADAVGATLRHCYGNSEYQREIELYRKEKELVEKELALAKREIEILHMTRACDDDITQREARSGHVGDTGHKRASGHQEDVSADRNVNTRTQRSAPESQFRRAGDGTREVMYTPRINISNIAELLKTFDGTPRNYEAWEG